MSDPASQSPSIVDGLKSLSPSAFEHLVFDLLLTMGLRNLVWRSPGADGGRDIEGDHIRVDFAGASLVEHWYVECKRYAESLSWPTVHEKLAFAENHQAHALLLCTTAQLSPQCKEEARRYQARRATPHLRFWDAGELENRVAANAAVLAKYRLDLQQETLAKAVLPLVHESNKVVQAAYALEVLRGVPTAAAELAAAMVELTDLSLDIAGTLTAPPKFRPDHDLYPWAEIANPEALKSFSSTGLRAALSAIRYLHGSDARLNLECPAGQPARLQVRASGSTRIDVGCGILRAIGLWSDIEITQEGAAVELRGRHG